MIKDSSAHFCSEGVTSYLSILVSRTEQKIAFDDKILPFHDGELILSRENLFFSSDHPEGILCYSFEKSFFDSLFYSQVADCRILFDFMFNHSGQKEYLFFAADNDIQIRRCLDAMQEEIARNDIYRDKIMHLLIVYLFTVLDRTRDKTLILPNSTMISDNRFGKILKYIGENYRTCTLQETALKFGYNPDYLSVLFRKVTGLTFRQKLLQIRLNEAVNLLLSTEMTVDQISNAIGFHDKSWFMRKFREAYGMTPSRYRKTHLYHQAEKNN